ncbi:helix-turn-helix transcriptional regulator [Enterococcus sp. CSURQ0835]|uniref:helix-turn-helix transcriptional regulator n=1 Tax=Enterococcus sp. CSURQ0835 TaxID=2681394 RepID=UPI00135A175F|nr:helix-turn-helix transcriptional regulator [Enterococcus sp. CSURQ0835]
MKVNNQIKTLREARKIPQNQMANDLGVSRQTMTAIEKMKYNPSLELSLKIARYFELPMEKIFQLEE